MNQQETELARVARLELSESDDACLRAIVKKGSDWRERERAETILWLASGASVKAIAEQQRLCREAVRIRRRKWLRSGLASLPDQPRCGAPSKLADEHREQIQQWVEAEALSSRDILSRLKDKYQIEMSATTLIASYGLRGCEVRALCLDNIDWSRDAITVFAPKNGRSRKLPLIRTVGEAILQTTFARSAPPSLRRVIFLSKRPPHAPLRSRINGWLADRLKKAGIETPRGGAHILRHSLAVHLLRGGQTLKEIGDVLGHRSPETTFIYTKLHVGDLRTVALDPEVVS